MNNKAYSNNGNSWRFTKDGWELQADEVLFDREPTYEELCEAFPLHAQCIDAQAREQAAKRIDALILNEIKPRDYDNTEQVHSLVDDEDWGVEAMELWLWIKSCWKIQTKILSGELPIDTDIPKFIDGN